MCVTTSSPLKSTAFPCRICFHALEMTEIISSDPCMHTDTHGKAGKQVDTYTQTYIRMYIFYINNINAFVHVLKINNFKH